MYSIKKLGKFNIFGLKKVSDILYECGKDMARKYDLHHWDNSRFKNWIIITLCALKNSIYLIYKDGTPVATFQTKKMANPFCFKNAIVFAAAKESYTTMNILFTGLAINNFV